MKSHGALHRSTHEVHSGFFVLAILSGALNVRPCALQAIQANAIGGRIEGGRHEGFHAMGDGVHAGGGSEHGGQSESQLRVANGCLGHNEPRMKAQFAAIVDNQNGTSGHFTASAAGGWHCDEGRYAVCDFQ